MTASHSSVSILFDQLKSGDTAARDLLIVRMQDRLKRLTAGVLRQFPRVQRRVELDDVLADLNLRLLRAVDAGVHPEGSTEFLKFAGFKLHQLLKDEANKGARRGELLPLDVGTGSAARAYEPGTDTYNPQHLAEWSDFWEHVNALPDEERTVFVMHYALQIPQKEIADELGVEAKVVSRRWLKATTRLHAVMPKFNLSGVA